MPLLWMSPPARRIPSTRIIRPILTGREGILTPLDSGMYVNGETTIKKWQLEGGYMLANIPVEFVGKWDSMDTDGYEKEWSAWDTG